jgi:hypothetical protein
MTDPSNLATNTFFLSKITVLVHMSFIEVTVLHSDELSASSRREFRGVFASLLLVCTTSTHSADNKLSMSLVSFNNDKILEDKSSSLRPDRESTHYVDYVPLSMALIINGKSISSHLRSRMLLVSRGCAPEVTRSAVSKVWVHGRDD